MSKELEALEKVRNCLYPFASDNQKAFDVIENALNDNHFYHHIIDKICKYLSIDNSSHRDLVETENEILNTILENENKLKALKIIKEKEVNVFIFLHSGDLETYNDMVEENRKLTQEECDLLKEVLL